MGGIGGILYRRDDRDAWCCGVNFCIERDHRTVLIAGYVTYPDENGVGSVVERRQYNVRDKRHVCSAIKGIPPGGHVTVRA